MGDGWRSRALGWIALLGNLLAVLAGLLQAAVALALLFLPLFGDCEEGLGSLSGAPAGECVAYWGHGSALGYQYFLTLALLGAMVAVAAPLPAKWRGGLRWGAALFGLPWSLLSFALGPMLFPVALLTLVAVALAEAATWFARKRR